MTKSILERRNAWINFKRKAENATETKIIECLEELQYQIDEIKAVLKAMDDKEDDGK